MTHDDRFDSYARWQIEQAEEAMCDPPHAERMAPRLFPPVGTFVTKTFRTDLERSLAAEKLAAEMRRLAAMNDERYQF